MKTGKHIYSGIVWALVLLIGSYPLSAPLSVYAMDLVLLYMDALSPAMQRVVSYLLAGSIMSIGMAAGFYFGFTRSKKADRQEKTRKRHNWELLVVSLLLIAVACFLVSLYRGFKETYSYGYFIQVSDQRAFVPPVAPDSPLIVDHGRRLKKEITVLDRDVDGGDGERKGKIRWYECLGDRCDDGWEPLLSELLIGNVK